MIVFGNPVTKIRGCTGGRSECHRKHVAGKVSEICLSILQDAQGDTQALHCIDSLLL